MCVQFGRKQSFLDSSGNIMCIDYAPEFREAADFAKMLALRVS